MKEDESSSENDRNLESLLLSLQTEQSSESSSYATANHFKFCHDVITLSKIPDFMSNIIEFLIILIYDFTICFQAIPFHLFESLSPNTFLQNPSTLNFIFSELYVQQISFAMIIIIIIFVFFQWISLLFYNPNLHMSTMKSSFLFFSFRYLPFLLSPIVGAFFGCLVLATSGDSAQSTSIYYAIILPITYLFLLLNYSFYTSTCSYNLIIGRSYFSFFSPPFFVVDAIAMFLLAFCTAFCVDHRTIIMTICASISIIWGSMYFLIKRPFKFINYFPNIFLLKLPIDAILYSLVTFFNSWFSIPKQLLFDLCIVLFIFGFVTSIIIAKFHYLTIKGRLEHVNDKKFNPSKIKKSVEVIDTIRSGIIFQFIEATDKNFLEWGLTHYCSEDLIVESVRICLAFQIPMNEMQIQQISLTPRYLKSLKFLAFQLNQFKKYKSDDSTLYVKIAVEELNREFEILKKEVECDPEPYSIVHIGKETRRAKKLFRSYAAEYASSQQIHNLWKKICFEVLYSPSKAISPLPNAFELLPAPFYYVFQNNEDETNHSVLQSSDDSKSAKPSKSPIERLTQNFANKSMLPYRYWLRLTLIVFVLFVISYNIIYRNYMRKSANVFSDISQLYIYGVSLSYHFIKNIDSFSPLPSIREIMEIIGISEIEAHDYRSNFELNSPELNSGQIYLPLFTEVMPSFNESGCPPISLLLASDLEPPATASIIQHRCYVRMMEYYVDTVSNYTNSQTNGIAYNFKSQMRIHLIFISVIFAILTVYYIIFFVKIKNKQMSALNIVKKVNTYKYEYKEPKISFSISISIFLWLVILAAAFALFLTFNYQIKSNSSLIKDCLVQIGIVSSISRNAMTGFAIGEFSLLDENYTKYYENLAKVRGEYVLQSTNELSDGIDDTFSEIEPLSRWSTPDSDSFSVLLLDFGHMMFSGNFSLNGYNFLMLRFLLIFNISQLANETLENMMASTLFSLQGKGSSFWISSIGFFIFALISWFLLEVLHSVHRIWFNGIRFILRRELSSSPDRKRRILELMYPENESILDKLPFPAIIVDGPAIVASNESSSEFTKLSNEQIQGQHFTEFFENDREVVTDENRILQFLHTKFQNKSGLQLVRIEDKTDKIEKEINMSSYIQKMHPKIDELPQKGEMYHIGFTFEGKEEDYSSVETIIKSIEEKFNNEIKRISIGTTFYRAVYLGSSATVPSRFIFDVFSQIGSITIGSLTRGIGVITAVVEYDLISVVCGEVADRGEKFLQLGQIGKCLVDEEIFSEIDHNDNSIFVSMKL